MENYLVSARKYRPSTFDSVVGQKALTATLRNAIASNRLAHAYLFCGSRGVGKTSCARIFAKTINCQNPTPEGNPCNECESCRSFNEGRSLNIVELDAASNNGVDDIRALTDQVQVPPTNGRYRVFIIDEVHMLSQAAFNAFLKTLEEPPEYIVFILATTEKHKILPTILSRCQIYDFNRITITDMVDHLEYVARNEGIDVERPALSLIASKADGAMRDALSIFDQVAASSQGKVTYQAAVDNLNVLDSAFYLRLTDSFVTGNVSEALLIYKEIRDRGFDNHFFINGLAAYIRDLMVAATPATAALLDVDDETREKMKQQSRKLPLEFYYAAMSLCNEADLNYRQASNKMFLVELLLIRLCQQQRPSQNSDGGREGLLQPIAANGNATTANATTSAQKTEPATPAEHTVRQTPPNPQPVSSQPVRPAMNQTDTVTQNQKHAPAPSQRRPGIRRGPTLRDLNETAVESNATQTASYQRKLRENPFTPDDVTKAWTGYMKEHPAEHILVNTMRASMPSHVDGNVYRIIVENHGQTELMTERLTEIYQHMRNALSNDSWELQIEENLGEGSPLTWSDREVLADILKNNETVRKLVSEFQLTL